MFCSNCGAEASGKFCSQCGAALERSVAPADPVIDDWSQLVDYATLIRIPTVRDKIASHASQAPTRLSGEDFLALCDKVVSLGVPLAKIGAVGQSMYARLGVKTGKERSETLSTPPGTTIVAALCSLAWRGHLLQDVQQFEDGVHLKAELPSDIWSFQGDLLVDVRRSETGTRMDGATNIQGQIFDWGKSSRCLRTLFEDVKKLAEEEAGVR